MKKSLLIAALMGTVALPAAADPIALILANEDYRAASDLRRGDEPADAAEALEGSGVRVVSLEDGERDEMIARLAEFGQMTGDADAMLVVLSGRFVTSGTETYFLPTDTGPEPLATLPASSLPLSTVLAYLATTPGRAILAIGTDEASGRFGPLLTVGLGEIDLPQGVTLATGAPRGIARFVERGLSRPGRTIAEAARDAEVDLSGFAARGQVFLSEAGTAPAPAAAAPEDDDRTRADIRAWRQADAAGTVAAYDTYLGAFPDGQFRRMAEARIAALDTSPEARAEQAEQALDLTRDQRREIQRDLSLLDYNTRGIDGIFGQGTRGAIAAWQRASGFDETGFLTREQVERLDREAALRARELEIEAEERRQTQLAEDRAYWTATGAEGDEEGLNAYLERYPDGQFAEEARAELDRIERSKRESTSALDRQLWDEARAQDTVRAYRDYLDVSPDGAFRAEARARIEALGREAEGSAAARQAQSEEDALALGAQTRRVIEQRLQAAGFNPGRVDGTFDGDTRRAIRQYQRSRNLEETGYLSEAMVVRLLADTVRSIFD